MLIVVGEAQVVPAHHDRLVQAAGAMARASRSDEGCESYGFYADVTRPDVLLSLEVWRDQESLDAHLLHPHTHDFLDSVMELVVGTPTMQFFHARPAEETTR